ncbi:MAG: hypothetical protein AAFR50_05310 [Pseudomonadota bacterium]
MPFLFIDAQHGLGNRLRAMASAAAIARVTGRDLVVIWRPDHHCDCELSDVINYPGPVINDTSADLARRGASQVYNYMEVEDGAVFEEPILPEKTDGDVYIRSAYTLVSPHLRHANEQTFLMSLRPSSAVRTLLSQVPHSFEVAVHIRMGTGEAYDHLSYEAPDNWPAYRHAELLKWRSRSHVSRFVQRVDALVEEGRCERLFLAADLPEIYEAFQDRYGDRVATLPRNDYDRSARQIVHGFADMLLLAMGDLFLASSYSSFSDLAQRFAPPGRLRERSGVEF